MKLGDSVDRPFLSSVGFRPRYLPSTIEHVRLWHLHRGNLFQILLCRVGWRLTNAMTAIADVTVGVISAYECQRAPLIDLGTQSPVTESSNRAQWAVVPLISCATSHLFVQEHPDSLQNPILRPPSFGLHVLQPVVYLFGESFLAVPLDSWPVVASLLGN